MNSINIVTAGLVLAVWAFFVVMYLFLKQMFRGMAKNKRGKKMLQLVEPFRDSLCVNSCEKIVAICTGTEFRQALKDYQDEIESGDRGKLDKVVLKIQSTFTFAENEGVRRPIHTGLRSDLEKIIGRFIFDITRMHKNDVSDSVYEQALQIIACRDKRLFVPYAVDAKIEEQYEFYGETSLLEAENTLTALQS